MLAEILGGRPLRLMVEVVDDSPHMKKSPHLSIVSDGFQVPCSAIIFLRVEMNSFFAT